MTILGEAYWDVPAQDGYRIRMPYKRPMAPGAYATGWNYESGTIPKYGVCADCEDPKPVDALYDCEACERSACSGCAVDMGASGYETLYCADCANEDQYGA